MAKLPDSDPQETQAWVEALEAICEREGAERAHLYAGRPGPRRLPRPHVQSMGASVHYVGTLPMSEGAAPGTVDAYGRSRDFENLWIVDGSTFPALPAKNLTFTLMANASRIASHWT